MKLKRKVFKMVAMQTQMPTVLTVSQLTNAIKNSLESRFPHVWLQGEVSNFKAQTSGHYYFSLKDSIAQIGAVMFRSEASALKVLPKDGSQVVIRGELNVYPQSGRYQIVVRELRYLGVGELLAKLEELKAKLHAKGWFKSELKKPLPKFPRKIGVVTSPTGAVLQDILNVLNYRFPGFHLILNPVRVQGEGSAVEIAKAIDQFNQYALVDVIIVGRGGGSIEDLWAFNEEIVAEAIFRSKIPIVSAVGHETDVCLSDFVADARAPTPSAAAAMVIADKSQVLHHLKQGRHRLVQCLSQQIYYCKQKLAHLQKHPFFASPYGILGVWMQRLDDLRDAFTLKMQQKLYTYRLRLEALHKQLHALRPIMRILQIRQHLASLEKQLDQQWLRYLASRQERLALLVAHLRSIDPKNLLDKGYAILFNEKNHSVIVSTNSIEKGQEVAILLSDGQIISTVKEIIKNE